MSRIAQWAIERPLYPWLIMAACFFGGLYGIETVGRLEDPNFPIKTAYIITSYPGASAVEVEQEVTDVIEEALLELPYIDHIISKSVPGRSEVQVDLLEHYGEGDVPQIWDELRRRVVEAAERMPPGAGLPLVEDDFGDVYGLLYAIAAPDYSPADIRDMSRQISTTLKRVPGVAKVQTSGEIGEAIFVELNHERLVRLGLPVDAVFGSIAQENSVVEAGSVSYGQRRIRIAPELAFDSVAAVGDMRVGRPGSVEIIRLGDIADISRGPVEVPLDIIRHNGRRVFTVGVSVVDGRNVVEVGEAVDARLEQMLGDLPLGVEVIPIYRQHVVVSQAIDEFGRNLMLSVVTVVLALCVFMGWRAGTVVGSVLLLTVMGTICVMSFLGIELQRISLGALMIAMGMLVDNAIVVAEGMVIGVRRGFAPKEAAALSVRRTMFPLLGATVIGILAFAPIGLSPDKSGYYLRSLFEVVAISLLLSWLLAITVVPLLGNYLLVGRETARPEELYSGWGYAPYRALLGFGLRRAWLAVLVLLAVTFGCIWGFQYVKQGFFPGTNAPLFYVDYYLPQGTDIHATSGGIENVERILRTYPEVTDISAFIGKGPSRFTSIVRPEQPNPAYAHLVVRITDVNLMDAVIRRARQAVAEQIFDADIQIRRGEFTSSGTSKIEARFSGPDPDVLRHLAEQALEVYLAHDLVERKTDWRQPELQIVPRFDEDRARVAGVSRTDVSRALALATLGVEIGLFRDGNKLLPIIARAPHEERLDVGALSDRLVWSPAQQAHIPMRQIVSSFELVAENNTIYRRDRERTIQARANPPPGHNPTMVFNSIRPGVEAIELPPGYILEWGGEHESSEDAKRLLSSKIPLTFGLMLFISILMFGKLRQPLVIWLTVPMTVCGVVVSLLVTDLTFTFTAFLGFLSLSGMLIKNCIVLVDEIDKRMLEGAHSLTTIVEASVSRLRPVMLAAGTTIAGMSPLLADAFFREMAVCIMGGLTFATLLTLVAVPVFYRIAFRRQLSSAQQASPGVLAGQAGG
jgi:multidrug efflux pump subunit AcrB